jgi:hypothetical protein
MVHAKDNGTLSHIAQKISRAGQAPRSSLSMRQKAPALRDPAGLIISLGRPVLTPMENMSGKRGLVVLCIVLMFQGNLSKRKRIYESVFLPLL